MWNLINYNYSGGGASGDANDDGNTPNGNNNTTENNYNLWSILGYEKENPSVEEEASQNSNDQKEVQSNEKKKKKATKHFVRVLDEDGNDVVNKTPKEDIKEVDADSSDKKKKKKKKKKKHLTSENRDKSPFLSDLSSYADYGTSDEGKGRNDSHITNEDGLEKQKEYDASMSQEEITGEEVTEETPIENEADGGGHAVEETTSAIANEWFFGKIKEILEPTMNQETISEMITNKYNSFNEANSGIFYLIENLLLRTNTQEKMELNKKQRSSYLYNHYNSMDSSINEHYNFVNYSIYCINKELAANVELEATKMIKIYNYAFSKFKKDINYKDQIFADLVNEADEVSTLIVNEKNNQKKRIPKIDFLILVNINSDNYNNIIESHSVQTPKLKLEEIFKINVN
ncbi:conserved Plasmodium protein, unknown function [Plasmodium knowlesi strain H]|uniref:Uncharacterized protein n=3 Tax=Plasmodium knowlesi TaxID=5850 RepID=A0A5E7X1Q7_PLAKH|nr:conserved Plasmodium protein, unknown function [Plasmodium knowlesi strain H]OTN64819.1 Uncharacterized protein PKNOH_S120144900 [Plasmodium knowlesi]CAA9988306.1 conserved Plasmodium protein, unknown function [Plasmodium knowlesi strain H]SBO20251.1 conserved Plasmodium protein, unknown function [Plasmodium knowlesi strain H]SBO20273.1 conserved Plasmodium protein, unknown function [Plasmodium knowlesi strain H]VVS77780.1 conserved Plasmodium protein, unknown function [Plasmodium knowlesi 